MCLGDLCVVYGRLFNLGNLFHPLSSPLVVMMPAGVSEEQLGATLPNLEAQWERQFSSFESAGGPSQEPAGTGAANVSQQTLMLADRPQPEGGSMTPPSRPNSELPDALTAGGLMPHLLDDSGPAWVATITCFQPS